MDSKDYRVKGGPIINTDHLRKSPILTLRDTSLFLIGLMLLPCVPPVGVVVLQIAVVAWLAGFLGRRSADRKVRDAYIKQEQARIDALLAERTSRSSAESSCKRSPASLVRRIFRSRKRRTS